MASTGAAGTPTACNASDVSYCSRPAVHAEIAASSSSWRAQRPSSVARLGSSARSGRPISGRTARHSSVERTVRAIQLSVPMHRYTPCGATRGSRLAIGGRTSPVRCRETSASTQEITPHSLSDISIHWPSPVRARWCSAAMIATAA